MVIIIGLGNPGEKFKKTRHNVGFMAVDYFAREHDFPDFEFNKKHNASIAENKNVTLVKPQTFMNESGKAVKSVVKNSKKDLVVIIHDDMDLPLGKIKIVKNRGSAGHKGVESIIKAIGNKDLIRFRVGIQPLKGRPPKPESFVIKNFTDEEEKVVKKVVKKISEALSYLMENGLDKTMNVYNG